MASRESDSFPPIAQSHPRSVITEAYRTLRTNVQFASVVKDAKILLITSSVTAEGKTSTAANLAVVAAESGRRVLLVDADLRKPQLHKRFRVSNLNGLSTVLVGEQSTAACAVDSGTEGLSILTSGPLPPNPAQLLASERFRQLVQEWACDYDLIYIDAPPVLSVADSLELSRVVEGVLVVIDMKNTSRTLALRAVQALRQVDAPLLGVVMNKVEKSNAAQYYYYSSGENIDA